MNTEARKVEEQEVLKKAVAEINGIKTKKEFINLLIQKALKGQYSHVSFFKTPNLDNPDVNDFFMMPSRLTTIPTRSYYENAELVKAYQPLVAEFFKIAGMDKADERAKWVVDFEKEYIKKYPTPAERRPLWSKRAYSKPSQLKAYKNLGLAGILAKVPSKVKIRNPIDNVFKHLDSAISKYSLDQLKSIYLFQNISSELDEAFPEYFKKRFAFNNKFLGGPPKRAALDERCTKDTMARFSKEIDHEVYARFFKDFPEKKFVSLLEQVRASIIDGLVKNTWLSKKSKAAAIKKIKMASFQVVKPKNDREWNFNPVAKYDPKAYIANSELLGQKLQDREFERLPKPVDKSIWWLGPMTVNAYYSPTSNKFVMPAGILQYPFYDPKLPDWVNLGAVGAVVGHELGHADVKTFRKRGEKLIAQFEAAGHNGKLTLGENIGDLVGVTFALNAAKKVMPMDPVGRDKATKEFFLQWGRAWCGVMRPKAIEMRLKTDPHALTWARVNEQMKHQPDFHRVYKCKAGDKLFLPKEEQVTIW